MTAPFPAPAPGGRRLKRVPAPLKLAVALLLLLLLTASPWRGPALAGGVAAGLLVVMALARLDPRPLLRRLLLLEPLVLGVAALNLLGPDGGRRFVELLARSTACLLVMLLLAATTPFHDLLRDAIKEAALQAGYPFEYANRESSDLEVDGSTEANPVENETRSEMNAIV